MAVDDILIVSAHTGELGGARAVLEQAGHRVLTAATPTEAAELLAGRAVALLLVDPALPGTARDALAASLIARDPLARVLPLAPVSGGGTLLIALVRVMLETRNQLMQLQMAERQKTELLASVSHELRSPLNVVLGYVELLREGAFGACSAEALAVLEKVQGNAGYLLELVEEFLDLSRVEAGGPDVTPEVVALTPFLRELAESFRLLVRTKPVAFHADIPAGLPAVAAEPAKLRVVVQNLLSNAEKFTDRGAIRLSAAAGPGGRVTIRVSDTGRGIPPEHHEAIFGLFQQLGEGAARGKGIGLGLALARRFARLLGGEITVESLPGRGSTFSVVLPATAPVRGPGDHVR